MFFFCYSNHACKPPVWWLPDFFHHHHCQHSGALIKSTVANKLRVLPTSLKIPKLAGKWLTDIWAPSNFSCLLSASQSLNCGNTEHWSGRIRYHFNKLLFIFSVSSQPLCKLHFCVGLHLAGFLWKGLTWSKKWYFLCFECWFISVGQGTFSLTTKP